MGEMENGWLFDGVRVQLSKVLKDHWHCNGNCNDWEDVEGC